MFNFDNYLNVNNINCTYIDSIADILTSNNNISIFKISFKNLNYFNI